MKSTCGRRAACLLMTLILVTGTARGLAQGVGTVEGLVVPSSISESQPFTFAVEGTVEQAIEVQTVSGEVVAARRTDKLGRIFLPAGLAAG